MNSDLIRCTRCNGRKTILGLGMIEKQCQVCSGIGWISSKIPTKTEVIIEKKPRGRKPKTEIQLGE